MLVYQRVHHHMRVTAVSNIPGPCHDLLMYEESLGNDMDYSPTLEILHHITSYYIHHITLYPGILEGIDYLS